MRRAQSDPFSGAAAEGLFVSLALGLMLPGCEAAPDRRPVAVEMNNADGRKAQSRNLYSPRITNDPYVVSQQRAVVEALEAECRHDGAHCAEAQAARRWMNERDTSD